MRSIRHAILFILGLSLIAFAFLIPRLGLDPNPGWGKRRVLVLLLGIFMLAVLAGSAKIEKLLERAHKQFIDLREKTYDRLHIPNSIRHWADAPIRKRLAYGFAFIACLAIILVYTWFATAGTWAIWPMSTDYYDQLATALVQGQVALDREVNPLLLKLPNLYDKEARDGIEYLWDVSLYKGKYYLYWGPMPAIIVAAVKLIHPLTIGDNLITFAAAVVTVIFQTLLLTNIWMRSFQRLPIWTLCLGIFLAGFVVPVTWLIQRPEVYEAAIISAQAFLMGGIYFAHLAFSVSEISSRWLAWASVFWVCAIASRTIIALVVIFLVFFVLISILKRRNMLWTPRFNALILALGVPMLLGVIGLGWYNAVRFDSVFEFGLNYQLTTFNISKHKSDLFSSQYVLPNINNYFFNPPEQINPFPYFKAKIGNESDAFSVSVPDFYYPERVTGFIYSFPFFIFAFLPSLRLGIKRIVRRQNNFDEAEQSLQWTSTALGGSVIIATASLFTFFYMTMRYIADVSPMLVVLVIIGFWLGYRAVSDWFVRFVYASLGVSLAVVSIITPNLLALLSSQNINYYSPKVLPMLDVLYKSIFSR